MKIRGLYAGIKLPIRRLLLGLGAVILVTVAGLAWFQYQQVERVTRGSSQGRDNFVWEFYTLELQLIRFQDALRKALDQRDKPELLADASDQYNIFASQVLLFETSSSRKIMADHLAFRQAYALSRKYLQETDPYLEKVLPTPDFKLLQGSLQDIIPLRASVHAVLLDAHAVQSLRSSQTLNDVRRFGLYAGMTSAVLLVMTVGFGMFVLSQLAMAGRRQMELESLHLEASHRASHDGLTNLVNRFEFEKHLGRVLDLARNMGSEHALMFVDLDRFKIVNDTCGHGAGDQLLRDVVQVICTCMRSTDTFGRLGGDEFGVILDHCSAVRAAEVAEQIRQAVDDYRFEHDGHRFHIGASIGRVQVHGKWSSTAAIMQAADSACYVAKHRGRNRVHAYEDNDSGVLAKKDETQWAQRIEEALDEDRFELHWQRIVPIQRNKTAHGGVRGEVLLRMIDVDGRRVSPGEFVPVAERFFLASRMDRWVLKAVFDWLVLHEQDLHHLASLSINLSGQSVGDTEFHAEVLAMMDRLPIDFRRVCFEVTETSAITNLKESVTFFNALRQRGARIALDDFGSGMSSFGYLKTLPADVLKIDGQFMRNLLTDPVDRASVQSMAQLARATHMETVAEWVETAAVQAVLLELGVDYAQGYLHHRPEPLDGLLVLAFTSV
jgi:diguanylate cyclase (GGDEF)-like protein